MTPAPSCAIFPVEPGESGPLPGAGLFGAFIESSSWRGWAGMYPGARKLVNWDTAENSRFASRLDFMAGGGRNPSVGLLWPPGSGWWGEFPPARLAIFQIQHRFQKGVMPWEIVR